VKKLVGRTYLEDALKRLDKLTHEEARMATAQVLKATHSVEERVRGVADTLLGVDDRVAGVGERVDSIDERVNAIDDKIDEVTEGTQAVFSQSQRVYLMLIHLDAKGGRAVTQQTSSDVDQVKSSSSPTIINAICAALPSLQGINYGRTFTNGYPHQIRLRTITSHVVLITKEKRLGSSKGAYSRNGCPRVRFFGFMVNVRPSRFPPNALR